MPSAAAMRKYVSKVGVRMPRSTKEIAMRLRPALFESSFMDNPACRRASLSTSRKARHTCSLMAPGSFTSSTYKKVLAGNMIQLYHPSMNFLRRLGPDPHAYGAQSVAVNGCPDILEIDGGDFAVIGINITATAMPHLLPTVGCGPDEAIVRIPRKTLVLAKRDIPDCI